MRQARSNYAVTAAVVLAISCAAPRLPAATARVAGFFVDPIMTGQGSVTALAFAPDGTLFFTTKSGTIKVLPYGSGSPRVFATVSPVYTQSECGLLGIALDSAYTTFGTGGHVYVFATVSNSEQRIIRFTDEGGTGGDREDLVRSIPTLGANHDGGCLRIGPDGKFYFAVGDGGSGASKSQDVTRLFGKVMRLNLDGTIPDDNPDLSAVNASYRHEIFAYGFRNPFRIAIRPTGPGAGDFQVFVNDVGSSGGNRREEVNLVQAGKNYGWPNAEGIAGNVNYVDPVHAYSADGNSIVGGVFYQGSLFPGEYVGNFFYMDHVSNKVFRMVLDGDVKASNAIFVDAENALIDIAEAPDGSLYYSTNGGTIHRIRYERPGNAKPTALLAANPTEGPSPLSVDLDAGGSSDTDGSIARYDWLLGDGTSILDGGPQITHLYAADGSFTARVLVTDDAGGTASATQAITVQTIDNPPVPRIILPEEGARFDAGVVVALEGSALDPEDGELAGDSLEWEVVFVHDDHTHPWTGGIKGTTGNFTLPDSGIPEHWVFRVTLTATDSKGHKASAERLVNLNYVPVRFESEPPGLVVTADGVELDTPIEYQSVIGARVELGAPSPQGLPEGADGEGEYVFQSWNDGGAATHEVTTTGAGHFFSALFAPAPETMFLRADSNRDGRVDISDPVSTLDGLFRGGPQPPCPDAADANDDGGVDISDAVRTLMTLFGGFGPLPPPTGAPGFDPTADELRCVR